MSQKGELTRRNIKEQAIKLFVKRGFKDVTMKDICEVTQLSRGGLYLHYGSTRQIFAEIIDDLMGCQEDEFSEKISNNISAKTILTDVLDRYARDMKDSQGALNVAIYEYFSSENESGNNALVKQYQKSRVMWRQLLEYGIKRGQFNAVDVDAVFDLIVFSYQGVRMYSTLMPIDETIPNNIVTMIKKIILKGEEE